MSTELPIYSIVAMATVTASLIAACIAFVNLTLTKELKTSEFRQAWINSLRDDLSIFFACARAFARASEELHAYDKHPEEINAYKISPEKVSEMRYQVAEAYSRVTLKLNQNEENHEELLRLMKVAIQKQNEALQYKSNSVQVMEAIETATNYARPLIKKEWIRVKNGEPAFRFARIGAISLIAVLFLAVICFITFGVFK
jgi:hypothetical protein